MRHDEVAAYAARLASGSDVTCPGFPDGLTPSHFGQAMTIAACWDEACEGLALAHGRPGLHAVPAAVALALDTLWLSDTKSVVASVPPGVFAAACMSMGHGARLARPPPPLRCSTIAHKIRSWRR
ncbi:unnamed protein product [Laminaria digitata]